MRWTGPMTVARRGAVLTLALMAAGFAHAADVTVSAAASLTNAFKELAPAFESAHPGTKLQFNFAASDALLAQIAKGAPVDVFASADQETMDKAQQQKLLVDGTRRNFVSNALVVITPAEGGQSLKALADLQQPAVKRVAIGKPEGVPAGRYNQERVGEGQPLDRDRAQGRLRAERAPSAGLRLARRGRCGLRLRHRCLRPEGQGQDPLQRPHRDPDLLPDRGRQRRSERRRRQAVPGLRRVADRSGRVVAKYGFQKP
ncbi:bacterial extracellular solute-binding protein [Ditylenchus destructor]|nr:bacterial extracellular solute-binding protein [Ditylenchus destructor]